VQRILFYARGESTGSCAACFAFTWSHGDTLESAIYQCHVFRCDIPEAVCLYIRLLYVYKYIKNITIILYSVITFHNFSLIYKIYMYKVYIYIILVN